MHLSSILSVMAKALNTYVYAIFSFLLLIHLQRFQTNFFHVVICAALKGTELNMLPIVIKGIVHPKMLIVIIYSLSCCTKPVLIFILVLNTKEDILKNGVTKQLLVPTYFESRKTIYGSHWGPATVWFPTFFKITFMFNRRKKLIQVLNNLIVSKWWHSFHLWVNYSFNVNKIKNTEKNNSLLLTEEL